MSTVLIVDDYPAVRKNLRSLLEGLSSVVCIEAGNGLDAIVELRWRLGDLPAILITADRSPRVRNAARAHNVRLLQKPLKPASLRALLGQWRMQVAAE